MDAYKILLTLYRAGLEPDILEFNIFAVPFDDEVHDAVIVAHHEKCYIILGIDAFAVYFDYLIPCLESARGACCVVIKRANLSGADKIGLAEHNGNDNNAHDKIDGSSGGNDYHALPQGLVVERVLILAVLVLALHADISADWQNAHGIVGLALLLFEDGGAHADRELVDLDLEKLCKKEMAELMEHYDDAEEKYSHKKRPDFAPNCRKRQRSIQKHIKYPFSP